MTFISVLKKRDIAEFIDMCSIIDEESEFMVFSVGEREENRYVFENQVRGIVEHEHSDILIATSNCKMVGYLIIVGNAILRKKHSVYISMGVLNDYSNKGIANELLKSLDRWISSMKVSRVELTVRTDNLKAIYLYEKFGFKGEGVKINSLCINNVLYNEYYMGKFIEKI